MNLKGLVSQSHGFTLVETVAGVTLLTFVMSTIGSASFQALKIQQSGSEESLAVNELRKAWVGSLKMPGWPSPPI